MTKPFQQYPKFWYVTLIVTFDLLLKNFNIAPVNLHNDLRGPSWLCQYSSNTVSCTFVTLELVKNVIVGDSVPDSSSEVHYPRVPVARQLDVRNIFKPYRGMARGNALTRTRFPQPASASTWTHKYSCLWSKDSVCLLSVYTFLTWTECTCEV